MAGMTVLQPNVPGFVFTEKLGSGTYATVYKAFRKSQQREVVAVKCILRSSLNKKTTENLLQEIGILKKIRHDYIVQLKDFVWDNHYIYLVMEYCSGGDLSVFIRKKQALPERFVRRFLQQLASALQFLHSQNITHMDLKPQNLLLSDTHDPVLKVADFGFAQQLSEEVYADTLRGSPLYMAPEIICKSKYDAKVDLWSVGVIMYECLFGQAPFASRSYAELAEKIKSSKPIAIPSNIPISDKCRDLLVRLLQRDPAERIEFSDFFQHPFIDLDHVPCTESLQKAKALVQEAVTRDNAGEWNSAARLYCQSLEYFLPAIQYERNHRRKEALRSRVQDYLARAEELKSLMKPKKMPQVKYHPSISDKSSETTNNRSANTPRRSNSAVESSTTGANSSFTSEDGDDSANTSDSSSPTRAIKRSSSSPAQSQSPQQPSSDDGTADVDLTKSIQLDEMATDDQRLAQALRRVHKAEFEDAREDYDLALELYQVSIGQLLPILQMEPKGPRRDLLSSEIQRYISRAEDLKRYLEVRRIQWQQDRLNEEMGSKSFKEGCSIQ
ncbi:serine/threonine-protein kinase ULK3-like [Amphiura filiformis]|uniref:serine/threonine-protein kinase ULK3-like n=1 Tax=Amphiura filiformis TaxID=82378 RepID=UPI003B20EDCF